MLAIEWAAVNKNKFDFLKFVFLAEKHKSMNQSVEAFVKRLVLPAPTLRMGPLLGQSLDGTLGRAGTDGAGKSDCGLDALDFQ